MFWWQELAICIQNPDGSFPVGIWLRFGHSAVGLLLWLFAASCSYVTMFYDVFAKNWRLLPVFGKTASTDWLNDCGSYLTIADSLNDYDDSLKKLLQNRL